MKRTPIRRVSAKRLEANGGRMFSTISSAPKRIRSVNPKAKAKRVKGYRKMLSGKEYRSARKEAMERAGNRCEFSTRIGYPGGVGNFVHRCPHTLELHAHHLRYPKVRPLEADDLLIVCEYHHEYLESLKLHKSRMF